MQTDRGILVFDLRPNIYKIGIYKEISRSIYCKVIFLSDLGVTENYFDSNYGVKRCSDTWLLRDFDFTFLSGGFTRTVFQILRMLLDHKMSGYDHVMVQGYNRVDYWMVMLVSRLIGLKVLYRGEGTIPSEESWFLFFVKSLLLKMIKQNSSVIFFTCSGNKSYLRHYMGKKVLRKLRPFSCAVDNKFYQKGRVVSLSQLEKLRKGLKIPLDNKIILFVGQLNKRKRPLDLICAVKDANMTSGITCLFVGSGPELENLKCAATNLGVHTCFAGFIEQTDIANYYSLAHIFCILSEYDNSPKVINEAMNFGLPIIATDVCGQAKDLISPETGRIVPVGEIETITESIDELLATDGDSGREERIISAVSKFSFARNSKELIDAL